MMDQETILHDIIPCIKELVTDTSQHARSSLASHLSGLSPLIGKEQLVFVKIIVITDFLTFTSLFLFFVYILYSTIDQLVPLFLQLLKDENAEVRLNVISKLEKVNDGIDCILCQITAV